VDPSTQYSVVLSASALGNSKHRATATPLRLATAADASESFSRGCGDGKILLRRIMEAFAITLLYHPPPNGVQKVEKMVRSGDSLSGWCGQRWCVYLLLPFYLSGFCVTAEGKG